MAKKDEGGVYAGFTSGGEVLWVSFAPDGTVLWSFTSEDADKVKAADPALYAAMSDVAHNRAEADELRVRVEAILKGDK